MKVQADSYVLLYSLYSYPNVILCFFGGFLLDRVFGVRWGLFLKFSRRLILTLYRPSLLTPCPSPLAPRPSPLTPHLTSRPLPLPPHPPPVTLPLLIIVGFIVLGLELLSSVYLY